MSMHNDDAEGRPLASAAPLRERIDAIDALRGLALFGVLLMNLETLFRVSLFRDFLPHGAESHVDHAISTALSIFVDLKAFAVFSLLFGIGLAIQHQRLQHHPARLMLLFRRLIVLLAFGLIHLYLIWNGDILTEYAIAGLLALPFLYVPTLVVAVACAVLFGVYLAMPLLPQIVSLPDFGWMVQHVQLAQQVYGSGTFQEILRFRIQEVPAIVPLLVMVFPRTLGLFLVGILFSRIGLVQKAKERGLWLWALAAVGIGSGLAASVSPFIGPASYGRLGAIIEHFATIALGVGYSCLVLALANMSAFRRMLAVIAPLGRMAFTNYIAQSLLLGLIFYGYGFGLFGKISVTMGLVLAASIYVTQLVVSRWWLERYRFGPLEWLWRALMYGNRPQMSVKEG